MSPCTAALALGGSASTDVGRRHGMEESYVASTTFEIVTCMSVDTVDTVDTTMPLLAIGDHSRLDERAPTTFRRRRKHVRR